MSDDRGRRDASRLEREPVAGTTLTQRRFLELLLDRTPQGGRVLDAACGEGRFWPFVLGRGRTIVGAEASPALLERAKERHPEVQTHRIPLEDLSFTHEFDGAYCLDATDLVLPDEWTLVVGNLVRAVRPGGVVALAVPSGTVIDAAIGSAGAMPLRREETAGFDHYLLRAPVMAAP